MAFTSNRTIGWYLTHPNNLRENSVFAVYDNNSWAFKEVLYTEMPMAVGRASNAFLKLGIKKGDKVNIHCSNCLEYIYSWFALGCIGAIMVPTDINLSEMEWEYVLNHSGAKVVITEPAFSDSFNRIRNKCAGVENAILCKTDKAQQNFLLFSDIVSVASDKLPVMDISPQDDAVIYYSQGSEKHPEGVVLTQAYYLYWGEVVSRTLKYDKSEVVLEANQISNPVHQICSVMAAFLAGSRLVLSDKFYEADWIHQVGRFAPYLQKDMGRGVVGFLTADLARRMLAQAPTLRDNMTALRLVMYTGELSQDEVNLFSNRFQSPMVKFFGMAECAAPFMNPVVESMKVDSVGRPTLGLKVKIVDDMRTEVRPGMTGTLAIDGGPGVGFFKGYYKNEDKTAKTINEGWLYTDMKAKFDEEGYFYLAR